jgi:hypothetical protein
MCLSMPHIQATGPRLGIALARASQSSLVHLGHPTPQHEVPSFRPRRLIGSHSGCTTTLGDRGSATNIPFVSETDVMERFMVTGDHGPTVVIRFLYGWGRRLDLIWPRSRVSSAHRFPDAAAFRWQGGLMTDRRQYRSGASRQRRRDVCWECDRPSVGLVAVELPVLAVPPCTIRLCTSCQRDIYLPLLAKLCRTDTERSVGRQCEREQVRG